MSRKFLGVFGSVAALFASQHGEASIPGSAPSEAMKSVDQGMLTELNKNILVQNQQGDEFAFVLKRSEETGLLMAYHRSHRSHSSHSSHRSHYSSR